MFMISFSPHNILRSFFFFFFIVKIYLWGKRSFGRPISEGVGIWIKAWLPIAAIQYTSPRVFQKKVAPSFFITNINMFSYIRVDITMSITQSCHTVHDSGNEDDWLIWWMVPSNSISCGLFMNSSGVPRAVLVKNGLIENKFLLSFVLDICISRYVFILPYYDY